MPSLVRNCNDYFMKYKDNDIESLKEIYNELQCDLEHIRIYKENYICTCVVRTIGVGFELDEMKFIVYIDDIEDASLCCNCRYSFSEQNSAAGEDFLGHYHPNFTEELALQLCTMVRSAIIGIEYGLKDLTDYEIDELCRENPSINLEIAKHFNSHFNDLEL